MLFTLSGAQLADRGSRADSSGPSPLPSRSGCVCPAGSEPPSPLPAAVVLRRQQQQDEPQTETPKDFWTLAQWADSVRRWLASPSRPPPGLRPPLPTSALANKLPALASWDPTDRPGVWVWERDRGGHRCCFGGWCAGLYLHHQSAVPSQGSRDRRVFLSVLGNF